MSRKTLQDRSEQALVVMILSTATLVSVFVLALNQLTAH